MLSFVDLRDDIYDQMLRDYDGIPPRPALHQPEQQEGDLTRLPAFPNATAHLRRRAEQGWQAEEAPHRPEPQGQAEQARRRPEQQGQAEQAGGRAKEKREVGKAARHGPEKLVTRIIANHRSATVGLLVATAAAVIMALALSLGYVVIWPQQRVMRVEPPTPVPQSLGRPAEISSDAGLGFGGMAQAGATFDKIKQGGVISCGVPTGIAGFAAPDSQGRWAGFNVDVCKALSAAIFGAVDKVRYVPLTAQQRFTALQSGEVDILSNNTTDTLQRDTALGLNFAPVVFYDGQGFMVPKKLGVKSAKELNGATICVQPGTTAELNLARYFRDNKMEFKPVVIEKIDEALIAFFSGRCDVYTSDSAALNAYRLNQAPNPDDYVILPERISKEPLAPVMRHGDEEWNDIVRWVVYALIEAEEKGITQKNVDDMLKSDDPDIKRMLGVTPGMGKALGLDERWAYNTIKLVGNYGEIFDRTLGKGTELKFDRGLNDLWTHGGLMYGMPIR
jgi:general L-amino acid transport system substrate-binding protein